MQNLEIPGTTQELLEKLSHDRASPEKLRDIWYNPTRFDDEAREGAIVHLKGLENGRKMLLLLGLDFAIE
jgi:hypothetical protein